MDNANIDIGWREGFGGFGDAEKFHAESIRMAKKFGVAFKGLKPEQVIEAAKDARKYPEWHRALYSLSEADIAVRWRLDRTHKILQWIGYRIAGKPEEPIRIMWASVPDPDSGERHYHPLPEIIRSERHIKTLLMLAAQGIQGWQKRQHELVSVSKDPVVAEAFHLAQKIVDKLNEAADRLDPPQANAI